MAWYNESWLKRKKITLTGGSSGAQTDYQVLLTVAYDLDMQVDFDDLRFTKADGTTLLNAWLESKTDSTTAEVWVETDTPADTVEADIYMYYGNSGASSYWDISSTFLFGSNFEFLSSTGCTISTEFGFFGSVEYDRDTTTKLSAAVSAFNTWNPDFVVENGDFIDSQTGTKVQAITDIGVVEAIYDNLTMDRHYVFGNHDLNYLTKAEFFSNTGKTSRYYSFDSGDHHFIVLDDMYDVSGNDIEEDTSSNPSRYISSTESTWLTNDLAGTSKKTIIFSEAHLYGKVSTQMIQNAAAIRTILENSGKVLACFHSHAGDNSIDTLNGIDYYSMYAMDNAGTNAYARVTVCTDDVIRIDGVSSQNSYNGDDTWTIGANASIESGIATLNGSGNTASIRATYVTPDNTVSTARVRLANTNCRDYFIPFCESTPASGSVGGMHYDIPLKSSKDYRLREDAVDVISGGDGTGVSTAVWHTQELIKNGTSWTLKLDGVQEGATTRTYSDSHPYYCIYAFNTASAGNVDIDYTYVRDYVANPATYVFGDEEPDWYDSNWGKRKAITLTGGADGAQTDYQIKLTVTWDSDMQADFDDLRFTKADGTTLIDAWMEDHTASTSATVWVEFPTTPANTVTEDYYMYYGNSGASDVWNMDNTFLFADDFDGSTIDTNKWVVRQGAVTVGSDYLRLTQTTGTRGLLDGKTSIPLNAAIHSRAKTSIANVTGSRFNTFRGSGTWTTIAGGFVRYSSGEMATQAYTSGSGSTDDWNTAYTPTSWHTYKTTWKSGEVKGYLDDVLRATVTSYVPTADLVVACYEGSTSSGYTEVDWIFVTKFASNPATYAVGDEEESGGVSGIIPVFIRYYRNLRSN